MKKHFLFLFIISILFLLTACQENKTDCQIATTTLPVYEFTSHLCTGTNLKVGQLVTQNVSCLHDYTLQSSQMRMIEGADTIIVSGVGLESFLQDALTSKGNVIDASVNIDLLCGDEHDHSHSHSHHEDPHIWLSPKNAKIMAENICNALSIEYPQYSAIFSNNLQSLTEELNTLDAYGSENLSNLTCRELITFHDGFSYFAEAFDLTIIKAVEEESGSEASASELKEIIKMIKDHNLPAIFTETNGSNSSAKTICAETDIQLYCLDMAMSGNSYFESMYHNIDTIKEALG